MSENKPSDESSATPPVVDHEHPIPQTTKKSIGFAVLVVSLVAIAAASYILATDIILILFLGLLFGIFLHRLAKMSNRWLGVSRGWCLAGVTLLLLLLLGGGMFLFGYQLSSQVATAMKKMDEGANRLQQLADENQTVGAIIESTPYVKQLLAKADGDPSTNAGTTRPDNSKNSGNENDQSTQSETARSNSSASNSQAESGNGGPPIKSVVQRAASVVGQIFSTTLGLVVNSLLIFFVGLFLATNPTTYRDGVVRLFPTDRRPRVREIMDKMGDTMWSWLLGRFGSMLITGVGAGIILSLLGIPMAISLGIVTGLLAFIPNIGGSIAFILAFFVALSQGFSTALWLFPTYVGLQLLESYVATPLIQQNQVSVPPALLIAFQAVFGIIFGFLGAAVASPLLAAIKVGVENAYIQDVLEQDEIRKSTVRSQTSKDVPNLACSSQLRRSISIQLGRA